jgi:hypothetical protein
MKKHPVQNLLDPEGIRTFSYNEKTGGKCLGAYCTLGGLLRAVSAASLHFRNNASDLSSFITEISGATTNSGRLFYWPNVRFVESETSIENALTTQL